MTDAERIAHLEAEVSRLHRALADQAVALAEHARRESAERERRESRRRINQQNYERRKTRGSSSDSDRIQTLNPPSPLLDGSPLSPAPSLPSPLSSPQPLFSSLPATVPEATEGQSNRPPLTLAFAKPDATESKSRKSRRERKASAAKAEPTGDPRHASLVVALVEAHREAKGAPYGFAGGKDARAVTELLALADQDPATRGEAAPGEILRRWGVALRWRGFPACTGLLALRDNWNAYIQAQDAVKGGDRPRLGPNPVGSKPAITGDRPRL